MTREEKLTGKYEQLSMFEKDAYLEGYQIVAGIDEAGRGPLAGPVVAAAVSLGDVKISGLGDSKTLSATRRRTGSVCSARYTVPMPPRPSTSRMR